MDETGPSPLTDPFSVLVGLGALCALVAAGRWAVVAKDADKLLEPGGYRARQALGTAAALTALAFVLAGGGYLIGRLTGRF